MNLISVFLIAILFSESLAFNCWLLFNSAHGLDKLRRNCPWNGRGVNGLKSTLGRGSETAKVSELPPINWEDLATKPWGSVETDTMYYSTCLADGSWTFGELKPYGSLSISPRAGVLNYGQGVFEGMKVQRGADGRIALFRPDRNARRARYGCERQCIPPVPDQLFIRAVADTARANARWVPPAGRGALYLRPLIIGTGPVLGVKPAPSYTFAIYASPVGSYFKGGQMKPVRLLIEDRFSRSAPGGTGGTKAIGNYAGSLLPQALPDSQSESQYPSQIIRVSFALLPRVLSSIFGILGLGWYWDSDGDSEAIFGLGW